MGEVLVLWGIFLATQQLKSRYPNCSWQYFLIFAVQILFLAGVTAYSVWCAIGACSQVAYTCGSLKTLCKHASVITRPLWLPLVVRGVKSLHRGRLCARPGNGACSGVQGEAKSQHLAFFPKRRYQTRRASGAHADEMDPELRDLMLGGHDVDASAPGGAASPQLLWCIRARFRAGGGHKLEVANQLKRWRPKGVITSE